ncbi:mucin-3B-like [Rhopilema esculentum]|uniref:mucin-3B-like n=1 Tax=Rhopilema esculentum TaxID=499914 RepID=UPI0031D85230|eukprot:gene11605-21842_t
MLGSGNGNGVFADLRFLLLLFCWLSGSFLARIDCSSDIPSSEACTEITPIGLANGFIDSKKLTASSIYSHDIYPKRFWGPTQARLKTGSCWCGGNSSWKEDWIQVDLGRSYQLTGIAIQGDPLDPPNDIEEFYVQLSDDGVNFRNVTRVTDEHGHNAIHVSPSRDSDEIRYFWSPVSVTSRIVRIKPIKLLLIGHNAKFCLRFELYGCLPKERESLLPVGLENGILPDSHVIASSSHVGEPPYHARLNMRNSWCIDMIANQWIQFDLGQVLAVKALTTQGRFGRTTNDMVSAYYLSFSNTSTVPFSFFSISGKRKLFHGNNGTAQDPVFNMITPSIIARYVRLYPVSGGPSGIGGVAPREYCVRAEIFAEHQSCSVRLNNAENSTYYSLSNGIKERLTLSNDIYSMHGWCAEIGGQTKVLLIQFNELQLLSGVIISGNPNAESWVTGFNMRLGLDSKRMEFIGSFKGTIGRADIAVNWLKIMKVARFAEIEATSFVGHKCFRVRLLGCSEVPIQGGEPRTRVLAVKKNHVLVDVELPTSANQSANNTILLKYACVNSSDSNLCFDLTEKEMVFTVHGNTTLNISSLAPGMRYKGTVQLVYEQSVSPKRAFEFMTERIGTTVQSTKQMPYMSKASFSGSGPSISNDVSTDIALFQSVYRNTQTEAIVFDGLILASHGTEYATLLTSQAKLSDSDVPVATFLPSFSAESATEMKTTKGSRDKNYSSASARLPHVPEGTPMMHDSNNTPFLMPTEFTAESTSFAKILNLQSSLSAAFVDRQSTKLYASGYENTLKSRSEQLHTVHGTLGISSSTRVNETYTQRSIAISLRLPNLSSSKFLNALPSEYPPPSTEIASATRTEYSSDQNHRVTFVEYVTPCWITYYINAPSSFGIQSANYTAQVESGITSTISSEYVRNMSQTISVSSPKLTGAKTSDVMYFPSSIASQVSLTKTMITSLMASLPRGSASSFIYDVSEDIEGHTASSSQTSAFTTQAIDTVSSSVNWRKTPNNLRTLPASRHSTGFISSKTDGTFINSSNLRSSSQSKATLTITSTIVTDPWTGVNVINRKRREVLPYSPSIMPSFASSHNMYLSTDVIAGGLKMMSARGTQSQYTVGNTFASMAESMKLILTSTLGYCSVSLSERETIQPVEFFTASHSNTVLSTDKLFPITSSLQPIEPRPQPSSSQSQNPSLPLSAAIANDIQYDSSIDSHVEMTQGAFFSATPRQPQSNINGGSAQRNNTVLETNNGVSTHIKVTTSHVKVLKSQSTSTFIDSFATIQPAGDIEENFTLALSSISAPLNQKKTISTPMILESSLSTKDVTSSASTFSSRDTIYHTSQQASIYVTSQQAYPSPSINELITPTLVSPSLQTPKLSKMENTSFIGIQTDINSADRFPLSSTLPKQNSYNETYSDLKGSSSSIVSTVQPTLSFASSEGWQSDGLMSTDSFQHPGDEFLQSNVSFPVNATSSTVFFSVPSATPDSTYQSTAESSILSPLIGESLLISPKATFQQEFSLSLFNITEFSLMQSSSAFIQLSVNFGSENLSTNYQLMETETLNSISEMTTDLLATSSSQKPSISDSLQVASTSHYFKEAPQFAHPSLSVSSPSIVSTNQNQTLQSIPYLKSKSTGDTSFATVAIENTLVSQFISQFPSANTAESQSVFQGNISDYSERVSRSLFSPVTTEYFESVAWTLSTAKEPASQIITDLSPTAQSKAHTEINFLPSPSLEKLTTINGVDSLSSDSQTSPQPSTSSVVRHNLTVDTKLQDLSLTYIQSSFTLALTQSKAHKVVNISLSSSLDSIETSKSADYLSNGSQTSLQYDLSLASIGQNSSFTNVSRSTTSALAQSKPSAVITISPSSSLESIKTNQSTNVLSIGSQTSLLYSISSSSVGQHSSSVTDSAFRNTSSTFTSTYLPVTPGLFFSSTIDQVTNVDQQLFNATSTVAVPTKFLAFKSSVTVSKDNVAPESSASLFVYLSEAPSINSRKLSLQNVSIGIFSTVLNTSAENAKFSLSKHIDQSSSPKEVSSRKIFQEAVSSIPVVSVSSDLHKDTMTAPIFKATPSQVISLASIFTNASHSIASPAIPELSKSALRPVSVSTEPTRKLLPDQSLATLEISQRKAGYATTIQPSLSSGFIQTDSNFESGRSFAESGTTRLPIPVSSVLELQSVDMNSRLNQRRTVSFSARSSNIKGNTSTVLSTSPSSSFSSIHTNASIVSLLQKRLSQRTHQLSSQNESPATISPAGTKRLYESPAVNISSSLAINEHMTSNINFVKSTVKVSSTTLLSRVLPSSPSMSTIQALDSTNSSAAYKYLPVTSNLLVFAKSTILGVDWATVTSQSQSLLTTPLSVPSRVPSSSLVTRSVSSITTSSFFPLTSIPPTVYGLAYVPMEVPITKDVSSVSYLNSLETKIIATYNLLRFKRKKRDVTLNGNTAKIIILSRRGTTGFVDVVFYVLERNTMVAAQRTVDTLNQMTLQALTQRFGDTVLGPVVVYGTTTVAATTTAIVSTHWLLGTVFLNNDPNRNLSSSHNIALFEKKIAEFYKTDGTATAKVNFRILEPANIFYIEFFVRHSGVLQSGDVIETFFRGKTLAALSASISWTVIALPYSISNIKSTDANHVKMVLKVASGTQIVTQGFKDSISTKITMMYREAKYEQIGVQIRGSVTTFIVSLTLPQADQGKIVFFILDKGQVLLASALVDIFAKLSLTRMATILGLEVLSRPALVTSLIPTVTSKSESYIWIIAVSVAAFLLVLLVITCLFYRWKNGRPGEKKSAITKDHIQRVDLPSKADLELKELRMNSDVTMYAQDEYHGTGRKKPVSFASNNNNKDRIRSKRRKVRKPSDATFVSRAATRSQMENGNLRFLKDNTSVSSSIQSYDSETSSSGYLRARATPVKHSNQPINTKEHRKKAETPRVSEQDLSSEDVSYENYAKEDDHLYESIKQLRKTVEMQKAASTAVKLPPARQVTYTDVRPRKETPSQQMVIENAAYDSRSELNRKLYLSTKDDENRITKETQQTAAELPPVRQLRYIDTMSKNEAPLQQRFKENATYVSMFDMERIPSGHEKENEDLQSIPDLTIAYALKQKAEVERSKNKLRQKEKKLSIQRHMAAKDHQFTEAEHSSDNCVLTTKVGEKSIKRPKRRWKSGKVDVAGYEEVPEKPAVKLNNFFKLDEPSATDLVDKDNTESKNTVFAPSTDLDDVKLNEAKQKIHGLLNDAFSMIPGSRVGFWKKGEASKDKVQIYEDSFTEQKETADFSEAPPDMNFGEYTQLSRTPNDSISFHDILLQRPMTSPPPWQLASPSSTRLLPQGLKRPFGGNKSERYLSTLPQAPQHAPPQLYKISPAPMPYVLTPAPEQHVYLTPVARSFENQLFSSLEENEESFENAPSNDASSVNQSHIPADDKHFSIQELSTDNSQNPQSLVQYIKKELLKLATSNRAKSYQQQTEMI